MPMTAEERKIRAQIAAHTSWSNTPDPAARTAPGRAALLAKFEAEVDPDGTLAPEERERRAEHARKAHFARMALASAKARKAKAAQRREESRRTA